jgi:membrane-associated protease RseP (regulator of RpoE activity)
MTQAPPDPQEQAEQGAAPSTPPAPSPGRSSPPSGDYETKLGPLALGALGAGLLALLLTGAWSWVVVIFGVLLMITIHELGHFLTAKWSGMKVTEFFLGFGPKLWSFQRGETEYGLKVFPAGAYVRIVGMNNLDEVPPEDEPRTYRQQSFPKRVLVVLAGPATHFVQAWVILFLLFAVVGVPGGFVLAPEPEPEDWIVDEVVPNSAASGARLEPGDKIVAWDGEPVSTFGDLQDAIHASDVGDEVTLTVERDGERIERTTEIGGRTERDAGAGAPEGSPFLGVGPGFPDTRYGVVESVGQATTQTGVVAKEAVVALGRFFSPSGLGDYADTVSDGRDQASEPSSGGGGTADDGDGNRMLSIYGAVRLGADLTEDGLAGLLVFFLTINVFVAIVNLVPLLPFDGGHAAVAIYERIRSRGGQRYHADVTKLLPVAYAVVFGLMVLGVTSLYLDIVNPVDI